jgi:hypothetical protein
MAFLSVGVLEMSVNLKTLTPDAFLATTGFLFGADSQASASPSVYSGATVAVMVAGAQRPATFWTAGSNYFHAGTGLNLGGLSTEGSNAVFLTSNGFRNNSGTWTSYGAGGGTGAAQIQLNPTGSIIFSADTTKASGSSVNPTARMTILGSGNVGIGTVSPAEELHVNSGGAEFAIQWDSTGSKSWVLGSASGRAYIRNKTDSVEAITILNNGRVGIGTASPATILHVAGGSGSTIRNVASAGSSWFVGTNVDSYILHNESNSPMLFTTNGTERMRIDVSGNILVGTSASPTTGTQTLTIDTGTAPTATPADTISIYSTDLSAGNTILSLYTEGTPVNSNTTAAATHRIAVRINGTVYYLLANTAA